MQYFSEGVFNRPFKKSHMFLGFTIHVLVPTKTLCLWCLLSHTCSVPVLTASTNSLPFKLEVYASASRVLCFCRLVREMWGILVKFKHRQMNSSTFEKKTLAMLLALQHSEVYACSSPSPVTVYTDHNPLVFMAQIFNHNHKLMCWALLVHGFNPQIKWGAANVVAVKISCGWHG